MTLFSRPAEGWCYASALPRMPGRFVEIALEKLSQKTSVSGLV